jgi:hypothetical protein
MVNSFGRINPYQQQHLFKSKCSYYSETKHMTISNTWVGEELEEETAHVQAERNSTSTTKENQ